MFGVYGQVFIDSSVIQWLVYVGIYVNICSIESRFNFLLFVYNGVLIEIGWVVVVYIEVEPIRRYILFINLFVFFFVFWEFTGDQVYYRWLSNFYCLANGLSYFQKKLLLTARQKTCHNVSLHFKASLDGNFND